MAGTLSNTVDIWLTDDLKLEMPEVRGVVAVAQRLFRRLTSPRGIFPFWPNKGFDVRGALLSKMSPARMKSAIEAECKDDEQVLACTATLKLSDSGKQMDATVAFTTAEGSYKFTMNVNEAASTYISLSKAN